MKDNSRQLSPLLRKIANFAASISRLLSSALGRIARFGVSISRLLSPPLRKIANFAVSIEGLVLASWALLSLIFALSLSATGYASTEFRYYLLVATGLGGLLIYEVVLLNKWKQDPNGVGFSAYAKIAFKKSDSKLLGLALVAEGIVFELTNAARSSEIRYAEALVPFVLFLTWTGIASMILGMGILVYSSRIDY